MILDSIGILMFICGLCLFIIDTVRGLAYNQIVSFIVEVLLMSIGVILIKNF